jgi:hypothetical protein
VLQEVEELFTTPAAAEQGQVGPARWRLAAFIKTLNTATLAAAVGCRERVPLRGVVAGVWQFCGDLQALAAFQKAPAVQVVSNYGRENASGC